MNLLDTLSLTAMAGILGVLLYTSGVASPTPAPLVQMPTPDSPAERYDVANETQSPSQQATVMETDTEHSRETSHDDAVASLTRRP